MDTTQPESAIYASLTTGPAPPLIDSYDLDVLVKRLCECFELCDGEHTIRPITASYLGLAMLGAARQITALRAALNESVQP